jgi:hypothetical protein
MSPFVYVIPFLVVVLQLVLIGSLFRGPYRQYLALLAYSIVYIGVVVVEGLTVTSLGVRSTVYRNVYWTGELILDFLLFLMVITMTNKALEGSPLHGATTRMLWGVVAVAILVPFVVFHPLFTSLWFMHATQLLSLGAAVLNLLLWTALLGRRNRDPQLLLVSAGLGVAVTGVAIAYGFFQFLSAGLQWLAEQFRGVTQVGSLLVWCWAFRSARKETPAARVVAVADPS